MKTLLIITALVLASCSSNTIKVNRPIKEVKICDLDDKCTTIKYGEKN